MSRRKNNCVYKVVSHRRTFSYSSHQNALSEVYVEAVSQKSESDKIKQEQGNWDSGEHGGRLAGKNRLKALLSLGL